MQTNFERAVFFSWHCDIKDCKFCYMSTQNTTKLARRSLASILAEVILIKKLGWDFGFFSGGIGAYKTPEFRELLEKVYITYGQKFWINVGPLSKEELLAFQPFVKGVVGSIETVNEEVHKEVCPSKPLQPYLEMFKEAKKLGLQNAATIIVGLGETISDFPKLSALIKKYGITKLHIYCLNPQKGTIFAGKPAPAAEYQAEWIRLTRQVFPNIDIQAGIWYDKIERLPLLLNSGANTFSKYPAIRRFGSYSKKLEKTLAEAGIFLAGNLTKLPETALEEHLPFDPNLKTEIKNHLAAYLNKMSKQANSGVISISIY
ncbi:MAG: radical SAM protein [Candidatus Woesearchaeota archaeon]